MDLDFIYPNSGWALFSIITCDLNGTIPIRTSYNLYGIAVWRKLGILFPYRFFSEFCVCFAKNCRKFIKFSMNFRKNSYNFRRNSYTFRKNPIIVSPFFCFFANNYQFFDEFSKNFIWFSEKFVFIFFVGKQHLKERQKQFNVLALFSLFFEELVKNAHFLEICKKTKTKPTSSSVLAVFHVFRRVNFRVKFRIILDSFDIWF